MKVLTLTWTVFFTNPWCLTKFDQLSQDEFVDHEVTATPVVLPLITNSTTKRKHRIEYIPPYKLFTMQRIY